MHAHNFRCFLQNFFFPYKPCITDQRTHLRTKTQGKTSPVRAEHNLVRLFQLTVISTGEMSIYKGLLHLFPHLASYFKFTRFLAVPCHAVQLEIYGRLTGCPVYLSDLHMQC